MNRITALGVAGLLGLGFLFTASAWSAPKQASKNAAKQANIQLDQQLEAIRATLNKADHDYQGHRAAAVHEITHAIHILSHGMQHPNPGQHFVAGKNKEPQKVSDAQLKQSLAALQSLTVPPGKHQAQVQAHIIKAIADLQKALTVA